MNIEDIKPMAEITIRDWLFDNFSNVEISIGRSANEPWDGATPYETIMVGFIDEGTSVDKTYWTESIDACEYFFMGKFIDWIEKRLEGKENPKLIWRMLPHFKYIDSDDGSRRYAIRARAGMYE